ncbi:MAG: GNAT family N-acetyltransferase [Pseudomonadota bacterium]
METLTCLPLQQHPHYGAALRATGCAVREVRLLGAAPVQTIARYGLTLASRGPVWRSAQGPGDASILRRSGLHVINSEGHDLAALHRAGYRQMHTPSCVAELSLTGTPAERLSAMRPKWRATLRRADAARLKIKAERFDPERHGWLLAADLAQQRSKKFRSLPHAVLGAYAKANPHDALVFVGYKKRDPIAAMLFLVHGQVATYHLGWTGGAGRQAGAHHALLVHASDHLAAQGIVRLDLGGVDTVNAPGLARFKIGTGATVRPLGGSWLRLPWL